MQVITGKFRGRKLISPDSARPTLQRVKISLFSIIREHIAGATVLDLFAGSGALGIECISEDALCAYFVEKDKKACNALLQNLKGVDSSLYTILNTDYASALLNFAKKKVQFDIIFIDPPYHENFMVPAVEMIKRFNLLASGGIIVCESDNKLLLQKLEKSCIIETVRSYGTAHIAVLK